jgi:histone acetyltransferase (RNA polymerase elongator complex component)
MRHKIIPVFIPHASCTNKCVFCNQNEITRVSGYDYDSVDETIAKCVRSFKDGGSLKEIAFYGGSFTAIEPDRQEALLSIAKRYIDNGLAGSVRVSTRPDCIDEETLSRLEHYGVRTIELGIQSMSDEVLKANLRGHAKNDSIEASSKIKGKGFMLGHQIMPGLYTDTLETMLETIEGSLQLKPDFLRVYPCLVVKGTKLHELYLNGGYKPLSLEEAVNICKVIYVKAAAAGVKIIRMGIHPDRSFVESGLIAGPFHPAFKHLVISSLFFDLSELLIKKNDFK